MIKFNRKTVAMVAMVIAILVLLRCVSSTPSVQPMSVSLYQARDNKSSAPASDDTIQGMSVSDDDVSFAPADMSGTRIDLNMGCAMKSGVGLASSLLPREVAAQEDFGKFAPEDILKGQNFMNPRNQIGIPETLGGTLRNANQQIRADPPNPKSPYTWNNSTIVPDLMRRKL